MLAITEKQKYTVLKIRFYNGFQYDQMTLSALLRQRTVKKAILEFEGGVL
jgi:hypothetical protein